MKKIIFLMALLFTVPLIAQDHKNTITVVGETETIVDDDSYIVLIALQQVLVYEGQGEVEVTALDEVKKNYIKKVEASGIDFNQFTRNTYYEFAMSYSQNRESEYYHFKTSNKEDVRKLSKLKSAGMSVVNTEVEAKKLTNEQLVDLSKKAIDNAKEKANALAKELNKSIGEIISIVDQNSSAQYIQSYGTSTSQSHAVTVSFELK
ncbi:SIMPL domain-containing protein [Winogradskyella helgolandensis]|uniref:SIMPL domain-containing protein n=1 Tax=Winogradskyella helgolandensis TaxID=2697010 RepID=UPI0015BD081A|nr:SIMPL domain-containing protein [Winogradskyella helgolandensis]